METKKNRASAERISTITPLQLSTLRRKRSSSLTTNIKRKGCPTDRSPTPKSATSRYIRRICRRAEAPAAIGLHCFCISKTAVLARFIIRYPEKWRFLCAVATGSESQHVAVAIRRAAGTGQPRRSDGRRKSRPNSAFPCTLSRHRPTPRRARATAFAESRWDCRPISRMRQKPPSMRCRHTRMAIPPAQLLCPSNCTISSRNTAVGMSRAGPSAAGITSNTMCLPICRQATTTGRPIRRLTPISASSTIFCRTTAAC